MAKGKRKDWRHRVTRQELAERKFIDEKVNAAFQATVDRFARERMDALYSCFVENARRIAKTYEEVEIATQGGTGNMIPATIHGANGKTLTGYITAESMERIFGDSFMPLGARGAIAGDVFLSPPEGHVPTAFHTAALAQAEIDKYGHKP